MEVSQAEGQACLCHSYHTCLLSASVPFLLHSVLSPLLFPPLLSSSSPFSSLHFSPFSSLSLLQFLHLSMLLLLSLSRVWLFCSRFGISYIYFTMNLKLKDCGIETYLRQIIPGILEVPARLYCILLLENLGRKCSLFVNLILSTISCFFLLFLPQGTTCQGLPPVRSLPGLPGVSYLGWLAKHMGGGFLHVSFAPTKEAPAPKTVRICIQSPERGTQAIPNIVILVCEGRQPLGLHSSPHR